MVDIDDQLQANTYIWSQSTDQITISFLVPENCNRKDLDIAIEHQYVRAGLKGQEPVLKGKLFAPVNHYESLWQLEKISMSPFSSLTTSPSLSIASSYALMSSPNHSPNSSMILPAPALTESLTNELSADMQDIYQQAAALGSASARSSSSSVADESLTQSPMMVNTPPTEQQQEQQEKQEDKEHAESARQATKYRILTIHLEKEREGMEWAVPVSKGWKSDLDIDVTSAYHLGGWFETRMADYQNAFRYYLCAAERNHTKSMMKVAALYEIDNPQPEGKTAVYEKDLKKAFEWYKRAADAVIESSGTSSSSGPDPLACYIVGNMYGAGSSEAEIEKNYEMALIYFNRAMNITAPRIDNEFGILEEDVEIPKSALRNHGPHSADERAFTSAAFQTGLIYLYGSQPEGESVRSVTHVEVDPKKAIRYWKEASMLGHAQASYNIGIMFANGMGVDQDLWQAGKWFGRAIKLDTTGKLVVPEEVEAVEWDANKEEVEKQKKAAAAAAAAAAASKVGSSSKSRSLPQEKQRQRKEKKGRKKRSKRTKQDDDGTLGLIIALGSAAAVAGIVYFVYNRAIKKID
ncbi:hypothetical protein INT45_001943 [Circinella minor]|uniref:CS domain-containing protein n=1 Tax=Circinella minor TaxID=1195481 RepID=A0A8H7VQZ2_9FUNG|nr:hypothetical protein INT45_001943 [Circinella minor]